MRECDLTPYDAATADVAFYTATSICMIPVTRSMARWWATESQDS